MGELKWAVAGWGAGGRVFHAPLIREALGIELVGVISTNQERAEMARSEDLETFRSIADAAESGIDGVTISTPAGSHAELALEALDAGLHVVVDKPFATTGTTARRMSGAARRSGRLLTVYQNRRWDGDFRTLLNLRRSRLLGTLTQLESRIERFAPEVPVWTRDRSSLDGGGVLVDLGPHLIDQAVCLFGPVVRVSAQLSQLGPDRVSEDDAHVTLEHEQGQMSYIVASLHSALGGPRFRLSGERGAARIEGFDGQEAALFAGQTPQSIGPHWGDDGPTRSATISADGVESTMPLERGRWDLFYPMVARAIVTGEGAPVPVSEAIHVCDIFDSTRESASRCRWVDVTNPEMTNGLGSL